MLYVTTHTKFTVLQMWTYFFVFSNNIKRAHFLIESLNDGSDIDKSVVSIHRKLNSVQGIESVSLCSNFLLHSLCFGFHISTNQSRMNLIFSSGYGKLSKIKGHPSRPTSKQNKTRGAFVLTGRSCFSWRCLVQTQGNWRLFFLYSMSRPDFVCFCCTVTSKYWQQAQTLPPLFLSLFMIITHDQRIYAA